MDSFGITNGRIHMRLMFASVAVIALASSSLIGDDKTPQRSIEEDWKAMLTSDWVNKKTDVAWSKLTDDQKQAYGNKGWQRAEVKFTEVPAKLAGPSGLKYRVAISFFAEGAKEANPSWSMGFKFMDEKESRYLLLKNKDDQEFKIEYSLKDATLILKGTYKSRDPKSAVIVTPTVFDGEYETVTVKK
jgi:hypothetical protein